MCGIAGIFRRRSVDERDPARLGAMAHSIVHRGPDDYAYLLLESRTGRFSLGQSLPRTPSDVLLASRRLSIIDTSPSGRQPITNETGDVFLVFNGEIYNYVELKYELLAAGHRFSSETDSEVIVHAYEEWGPACVGRFNGMWAFAIWDQRQRRLFCSRDRFGVKPFYYCISDDGFIFGSEIKAILHASPHRASPHYASIHAFLTRRALCRTDETFFEGIKRLPPAHSLLVSSDRCELTRYWDYDSQTHRYDYGRPEETFAGLLEDAVRLRFRSDVPVGIALSGGMDSSSIAAVAQRHMEKSPIKVFTAEFPGTRHDERRHAELVARRYGMEFHTTEYRPTTLIDDLRRVIWHMDHPVLVGQVLPRWQLMELASRHVKVILEGQGSDEMLAGYSGYFGPWFRDELYSLTPLNLPWKLRRLAAAAMDRYHRVGLQPVRAFIGRYLNALKRFSSSYTPAPSILTPEFRELTRGTLGDPLPERRRGDRLTNDLRDDHSWHVLPHLLMFGDAISMGHSLESRLPFLDYRLVEFVFGLSADWKYDGIESKIVLRRALKDVLPPEILARKDKVGFGTPVGEWLRSRLDSEVRPILLSEPARGRGILDPQQLDRVIARLAAGNLGAGRELFRLLALEIWFRLFIDGEGAGPQAAGL